MSYGPAAFAPPQKRASANIRPLRALAASAGSEELVAEATGNTLPFVGVAYNSYKYAYGGYEQQALPYAAQTGDAVPYRSAGMIAEAQSGAAISNLGRPLGSDGSGRVVSVTPGQTTGGTYILGFPLDTAAAADEVVRVTLVYSIPILV